MSIQIKKDVSTVNIRVQLINNKSHIPFVLGESFMNFCNKQEKKYQEGYIRKAKKVLALIEEIGGNMPFINMV